MSAYWANFVKSSDPNGADLPHWQRFDREAPVVMELGDKFSPYHPEDGQLDLLLDWMSHGLGRSIFGISSFPAAPNENGK